MANPALQTKLDAIFNAHMSAELAADLEQTLATMSPNPHLVNIPTMVGGQGAVSVRTFYSKRLVGQFFPPDVVFETVSRTYSEERLVDDGWTDILPKVDEAEAATDPADAFAKAAIRKMERIRHRVDEFVGDMDTAEALKPWYHFLDRKSTRLNSSHT